MVDEQQLSGRGAGPKGPGVVDDPKGGFVLALVVLLLFGIGVAAAAGYQIVVRESLLSVHAKETQSALSIARAGLRLYIGKQIGVHEDTVTYSMEGGDAVVTARLVAKIDDFQTLYLLGSEGVYKDPTFTGSAARRTVYQYAVKREIALDHMAALTQASGNVRLHSGTSVLGNDQALSTDCEQSQTNMIGIMMGSGALVIDGGATVTGSQISRTVGSPSAALDSLGLDWDLLTDPDFPVDYDGVLPPLGLPVDSFPVTRFPANLTVASGDNGRRGVLIVTGDLIVQNGWIWDGVVLAGYLNASNDPFLINGLVVSGLDGAGGFTDIRTSASIRYNRCYAFQAGKRLSHFKLVGSTWWEEM